MAILGKLIKSSLKFTDQVIPTSNDVDKKQKDMLQTILKTASKTAFGLYHGFDHLLEQKDMVAAYQQEVPITDYHTMHDHWWRKQQIYPDITWPGKPNFFALSSGTTGKESKRIPITNDMISYTRRVGLDFLRSISQMKFEESLFEREVLVLSSSSSLSKTDTGFHEGEISGINVQNFPGWYDVFYRPGKEIAEIPKWEDRLERMVQEAPSWNLGSMAGIPSWMLMLLREIIEYHKLDSIHDIWPDLQLFASGGVAYDTYRESFDALMAKPIYVLDTYLASEGFFAYGAKLGSMDMRLATNHGVFYEFIPFTEEGFDEMGNLLESPQVLTIDEVEPHLEYALLVTSVAGLYRYMIGDTIKFSSIHPFDMQITGRTKFFLNVVGSQLSEEKMNAAIVEVAETFDVEITEFIVSALRKEDEFVHHWILVCSDGLPDKKVGQVLDASLKKANKNYKVARDKALKDVLATCISSDQYQEMMREFESTGGQTKIPKVVEEEKMNRYLKFLQTN